MHQHQELIILQILFIRYNLPEKNCQKKNLWNAQNRNRGCWARRMNTTSTTTFPHFHPMLQECIRAGYTVAEVFNSDEQKQVQSLVKKRPFEVGCNRSHFLGLTEHKGKDAPLSPRNCLTLHFYALLKVYLTKNRDSNRCNNWNSNLREHFCSTANVTSPIPFNSISPPL